MPTCGLILAAVGIIATAAPAGYDTIHPASRQAYSLPSPQEVKRAVVSCGVLSESVSIQFERDMDEDVVWIASDSGNLSNSVLGCVAKASLKTHYYVYFRDPQTQKIYDPGYWQMSHDIELSNAKGWLQARNLLSTMPHPVIGQSLSMYAEAVEDFCGVKKKSLLVARDEHSMTFAEGGLGHLTANGVENPAANETQFTCVMNATSAVDLNSQGIFFGFIGNAARAVP